MQECPKVLALVTNTQPKMKYLEYFLHATPDALRKSHHFLLILWSKAILYKLVIAKLVKVYFSKMYIIRVHYVAQKAFPLVPNPRPLNTVHNVTLHFQIRFNNILQMSHMSLTIFFFY